jgi:UDP-glucose 4-epimerase
MNNFLITGGCGFIGIALIKKLLLDGFKNIRVIDNLSVGKPEDLKLVCDFQELKLSEIKVPPSGVELVIGDIVDSELAKSVSQGCDVIVHLAANTGVEPSVNDPRKDMMTNIIGTFNYLEAARLNKTLKFIFSSSGAPAGEVVPPIHEEIPLHPVSPYGASKLAGEGYCSAYKKTFDIDTVSLRFGNVYGPGSINKLSVIAKFISQALDGKILKIYGDGLQTRDFIYIDDLIQAIMLSITSSNVGGETFQIANNKETSIIEIVNLLIKELNQNGIKNVLLKNVSPRLGDVKRNFSDTSKAHKILGWHPKVPLDEGISKTVSYFLNKFNKGVN